MYKYFIDKEDKKSKKAYLMFNDVKLLCGIYDTKVLYITMDDKLKIGDESFTKNSDVTDKVNLLVDDIKFLDDNDEPVTLQKMTDEDIIEHDKIKVEATKLVDKRLNYELLVNRNREIIEKDLSYLETLVKDTLTNTKEDWLYNSSIVDIIKVKDIVSNIKAELSDKTECKLSIISKRMGLIGKDMDSVKIEYSKSLSDDDCYEQVDYFIIDDIVSDDKFDCLFN